MNKDAVKKFLSTPRGKLVIACSALGLCWLIMIPVLFADFFSNSGNPQRIKEAKLELAKCKKNLEVLRAQKRAMDKLRKEYKDLTTDAWRNSVHGMIEVGLRQKISDVVNKQEDFKLTSLGSVRTSKINNDLFFGELDVSASDTLDKIIKFIAELEKIKPQLFWKRLDIRPDKRTRPKQSNNIVNLAVQQTIEATQVSLSGTVRVLGVIEDESIPAADTSQQNDSPAPDMPLPPPPPPNMN